MNLKQAEIVLEKITRLYKSMKLDERNIDVFEQDLMLSYIRQLYESFSPEKAASKRIKPELPPIEPAPQEVKAPVKATPAPKPEPKPEPVKAPEKPKIIEVPESLKTEPVVEKPKPVVKPKPAPAPKPVATPKPAPPPPAPKPEPSTPSVGLSPAEKASLFEFKQAKELSEKLSMAPIRDLTKAMGLNEKIFTINELFGGDNKLFDETMRKLNTFGSYEAAATYLSAGVAYTQGWTKRNKKKKAIQFVQLVKRRYVS